jgi:hypothetical protein
MKDDDLDHKVIARTRRLLDLARHQRTQIEIDLETTRGMIQRSRELLRKLRMWPKGERNDGR